MSHAQWKARYLGPDWYDTFKLMLDLHTSSKVSVQVTFEPSEIAGTNEMLCIITAVPCPHNDVSRVSGGTHVAFSLRDMSTLPCRVHQALSDLYDLLDTTRG